MLPQGQTNGQLYGYSSAQKSKSQAISDSWISNGYASQGLQKKPLQGYQNGLPAINNIILESPLSGVRRETEIPAPQQPYLEYRVNQLNPQGSNHSSIRQFMVNSQTSNQASPMQPLKVNRGILNQSYGYSQPLQPSGQFGIGSRESNTGRYGGSYGMSQGFASQPNTANQSPLMLTGGLHLQNSKPLNVLQLHSVANDYSYKPIALQQQYSVNASPAHFSNGTTNEQPRGQVRSNIRSMTPKAAGRGYNPLKSPELKMFRPSLDKNTCNCGRTEDGVCEYADHWMSFIIQRPSDYHQLEASYRMILQQPRSAEDEKQIGHDVSRTFPDLTIYTKNTGETSKLSNILNALASHLPDMGYVQGINFIVASILYHVQEEYLTFWIFVHLCNYLDMNEIYRKGRYRLNPRTPRSSLSCEAVCSLL